MFCTVISLTILRKEPKFGKFNMMASHTWELILNWNSWAATIGLRNQVVHELVEELEVLFQTLYTWNFKSDLEKINLLLFRARVRGFVKEWREVIGRKKERNYYYWLEVEAIEQIDESGSVWKYASDITESFVHLIKVTYARFTNRGGRGRHWTKQVLQRILVKVHVTALNATSWDSILTKFESRKFIEEFVRSML